MTAKSDLKRLIRARAKATGQSYARARDALLASPPEPDRWLQHLKDEAKKRLDRMMARLGNFLDVGQVSAHAEGLVLVQGAKSRAELAAALAAGMNRLRNLYAGWNIPADSPERREFNRMADDKIFEVVGWPGGVNFGQHDVAGLAFSRVRLADTIEEARVILDEELGRLARYVRRDGTHGYDWDVPDPSPALWLRALEDDATIERVMRAG